MASPAHQASNLNRSHVRAKSRRAVGVIERLWRSVPTTRTPKAKRPALSWPSVADTASHVTIHAGLKGGKPPSQAEAFFPPLRRTASKPGPTDSRQRHVHVGDRLRKTQPQCTRRDRERLSGGGLALGQENVGRNLGGPRPD